MNELATYIRPTTVPIAIVQPPAPIQIIFESANIVNQINQDTKVQININNPKPINTIIQPASVNLKFDSPIVNNKVCKDITLKMQTQIIRDHSGGQDDIEKETYTGPHIVTPTRETQILTTNNKYIKSDIIVNPIPPNYGLITWNGSCLTIS